MWSTWAAHSRVHLCDQFGSRESRNSSAVFPLKDARRIARKVEPERRARQDCQKAFPERIARKDSENANPERTTEGKDYSHSGLDLFSFPEGIARKDSQRG